MTCGGVCLLAVLWMGQVSAGVAGKPREESNAVADALARAAVALGIDFYPKDAEAPHPAEEDVRALHAAGARPWLEGQLSSSAETVAAPPKELREFLEIRRVEIGKVVGILERGAPDWSIGRDDTPGPAPQVLALIRLDALLVAAALAAEHEGSHVDVRRLLEASWSIYRGLSRDSTVVSRIVATGVMKFQVGALRKLQDPPVEWLNRLESEDAWKSTLDAYERDQKDVGAPGAAPGPDALPDSFPSAHARAVRVWMEALRRVQPCQIGRMTAEEIGRPMREELQKRKVPGEDSAQVAEVFTDIEVPQLIGSLERAGRLVVDSELTAKILELKLDKAASKTNQWPPKLAIAQSRACPDAVYEYRTTGETMSLSFKGTAPVLSAGLSLPLSFSSGAPPVATPVSRAPRATLSPAPTD